MKKLLGLFMMLLFAATLTTSCGGNAEEEATDATEMLKDATDAAKDEMKEGLDAAKEEVQEGLEEVKDAADDAVEEVKEAVEGEEK